MPILTRRRDPDTSRETWLIHYGDIHVDTISMSAGVPGNVEQWSWSCGFYPASHRGLRASGTAKSFVMARGPFETAWHWLLAKSHKPTSMSTAATRRAKRESTPCGTQAASCRQKWQTGARAVSAERRYRHRRAR
jgi:hypothetical protein